jgi:hypothetical protein
VPAKSSEQGDDGLMAIGQKTRAGLLICLGCIFIIGEFRRLSPCTIRVGLELYLAKTCKVNFVACMAIVEFLSRSTCKQTDLGRSSLWLRYRDGRRVQGMSGLASNDGKFGLASRERKRCGRTKRKV